MDSVINSFEIDGYVVKIETDTIYGKSSVAIVGQEGAAVSNRKSLLSGSNLFLEVLLRREFYQ